ncbi:hypothetical protein N7492_007853 [Penicillium capsulatum]|uniref:J domain-containing protein n=1 Tax=Penicillium capsulatum TaxID=69766 RepID=A0A9W9I2P3_9EURO|nr:hypothetical protein N7492_007853 [Penicillium capsulatum]KAJ6117684.1 hypothetical protein N7512_007409 [Penicillium capsulatum]
MGQSQSTSSQEVPEQPSNQKTDYYELLGVARGATDDEIKKAYRKKALQLHPDRNYGNVEEATRLFAEIQSAYEVLADPQERAWYDSHSDAFLGTDGATGGHPQSYNVRVTTTEDVLRVFSRFSPRMEFSDSPTGFFGGLSEQFARLALEERLACQEEGEEMVDYPSFGSRDDDFDLTVRPFYNAWSGFSTRKSFAWKDAYRYSEAPDRRVRRLMEKENRRLREEGIREFNDAVRSLVAFVKKRDPRYKANAQSEAQRQETLRQSVAAQAARSRAINQAKMREHVIPDWAQSEQPVDEDAESSDSELESFECVACRKHFKSQKQFEAHERSKKHLKAVKQLCREMRVQDKDLELGSPSIGTDALSPVSSPEIMEDDDDPASAQPQPLEESKESLADSLDEVRPTERDEGPNSGSDINLRHHAPGQEMPRDATDDDHDDHDDDYASRESIEMRLHPGRAGSITQLTEQLSSSGLDDGTSRPQVGKAKQKRAKKAARVAEQPTENVCTKCHATFASKTKLFAHLQENPSHAHLKPKKKNR